MNRRNLSNALPLTPSQSLMWIDGQLHPTAPINNMVTRLDIKQPLEVDAFRKAFAILVARHEAMRLMVSIVGEQFVATVTEELQTQLPFIDYSTSASAEKLLQVWIQQRCLRVFGFDECLYEAALIKLSDLHYVFFMNQHHCVTDGRSCQVMLAALDDYYSEQIATGNTIPSRQNGESRPYTEYLQWHSDQLRSDQAKASEAYWAQRYERPPEPVRLYGHSTDKKRLATQRHACVLTPELSKKIIDGKKATPPSILFVAVLFAFLRRMTGNSDLCIAVPLLNRAQDFATTLGLFMEISRNRLTVTEEDSFATLLEKLRVEAASIKPHRSHTITSRNGRYEAMLNYRAPADIRFGGKPFSLQRVPAIALLDPIPGDEEASEQWAGRNSLEVDITHNPATGEFYVAMDFNTGVWPDKAFRERSLQHFLRLLEYYFDNRTETLESLDLVTQDERKLLTSWNKTAQKSPHEAGVHELFEAQVDRSPTAIALEFRHEQLSYHELNCRANQLAHALIRGEVKAESMVGIQLHRSVDLVVALLATLKAGAAYVPLDPSFPETRLQQVINEANLHLLLTEESLAELRLEAGEYSHNPALASAASNLAYVIFTSGSTGRPKGVMIEQGALVNFIHAAQSVLHLTDQDRLLSTTTVSFDIFVLEMFLPLVCGARMVLASDESVADGRLLAQDIYNRAITHFQATPTRWQILLDADWRPSRPFTALVGGELLTADLAEKLTSRCTELRNWYGPTEATVWASQLLVGDHYRAGNLGRPLANYRIDILDTQGRPAPIGVAGEIAIGGSGLARGYLNRADLTAEAFIHREGLGRLYRTGDLGRWTTDGQIEFIGRNDFQVKVRGYRIELAEIEAILHTHPNIMDALVIAREGGSGEKILAAFYRSKKGQLNTSDLRSHLKQSLPDYMVPSFFVLMDEFPLTPNGKIDRNALPAPVGSKDQFEHSYVAPEDEIQRKIAAIWADVLSLPRVGIRDNFFDLGGHSLLALRLVSRVERETGIHIPLIDLFQGKTIEEVTSQPSVIERALPQSVVPIRAQGHLPPFFAIGSHPRYVDAAERVDSERPFYRLDVYAAQSVRLMLGKKLHTSVDSIVLEFVDHIQEIQPNGPYFIGGGCEGAQVAFGVAGELAKRGEKVEKLILWLAMAPQYGAGAVFGKSAVSRVITQLKTFLGHAQAADFKWHALVNMIKHEYIEFRIFRAMDTYRPTGPFNGEIVVARTIENRKSWDTDLARGWGIFATGGVRVHILSGDHDTWLADYAEQFGDFLDTELSHSKARSLTPRVEPRSSLEPICTS